MICVVARRLKYTFRHREELPAMSFLDGFFIVIMSIAAIGVLIVLPFYLVACGGIMNYGLVPLQRCFDGITLRTSPQKGDVSLTYHTYRGVLVWVTQEEIAGYTTPEEARTLLKRLLKFNLTWGMLSYGLIFIPLLAIGNYFAQMRSIRIQSESK